MEERSATTAALVAALLLTSLFSSSRQEATSSVNAQPAEKPTKADAITFGVNQKTGLCFAFYCADSGHDIDPIAHVPCTKEVLASINQGKLEQMKAEDVKPEPVPN